MERFTSEQVETILKLLPSKMKTDESIQQVFGELYRYKKLDEEIGCPLEEAIDVLLTLRKYMSIELDSSDDGDYTFTFDYIDFGGEALQIDNKEDFEKVKSFIYKCKDKSE